MPTGIRGFQKGNKLGQKFQKKERTLIQCQNCEKEVWILPWEEGRKYCSASCRSLYTMKGKKHWNWQGGISSRWDSLHNSKEYKAWRLAVYQRDKFACQECGQGQNRKNPLHAHHIKPKSAFPELVLSIDNGLTLCKSCHVNLHSGRHS